MQSEAVWVTVTITKLMNLLYWRMACQWNKIIPVPAYVIAAITVYNQYNQSIFPYNLKMHLFLLLRNHNNCKPPGDVRKCKVTTLPLTASITDTGDSFH